MPRVLVVDDEPLIRWWLDQSLSEHGYHVVDAENAEAALSALTAPAGAPDVVLIDYHLPGSHDLRLLVDVVHRLPNARVILMSAYAAPDVARQAIERGAFAVLNKPFEVNELVALLNASAPLRPAL